MVRRTNAAGFTLMELLVVIVIIGLLASVVLASLSSARQKGRNSSRVQQIKEYQKALELAFSNNSAYPGPNNTNQCLGDNYPGGNCWGANNYDNATLQGVIQQFIPSFPPMLEAGNLGAVYNGTANGAHYRILWGMEGQGNCTGGRAAPSSDNPAPADVCDYCQIAGAVMRNNIAAGGNTQCQIYR